LAKLKSAPITDAEIRTFLQQSSDFAFESIRMPDVGCEAYERERRLELVEEQVRRVQSVLPPPVVDRPNLTFRFGSGSNSEVHRLFRSSSMIAFAGWGSLAFADAQDRESASCKA
jgi:hypothetical protein